MSFIEALILGIIQGLTEFLPVSSSGHLELAKVLFGDNSLPEESMLFTVVLHAATALSTIVIFRKEILEILSGLLKFKWNDEFQFSLKIVLSMIPAAGDSPACMIHFIKWNDIHSRSVYPGNTWDT